MPPAFYPRLHCLSVLNLIYHGNFDYPLNPWCTSFAGDSGVGKSMIADLLQLIFVGKDAYRSATHAQGARPPEGLVLNDATSGGKGLGYAFLTVEVGAGRFLVVGCYLAAAAKAVVPFIVQQGISFAPKPHRLQPLDRPLGYRDLLPASGQVLPLTDMPAHMQRQQATIKFFEHRLGDFHRLLFDNELLPLDVNQPGVLKSYANIIRSFSRSGDLDQHKNKDDLKRFLFGEEAQRSIWHDYQERVKEIEQQLLDYRANDGRAKDLERKLTRFHSLHIKHQAAQLAQAAWRLAQVEYWQGETRRAEDALMQATNLVLVTEAGHWQLQHTKSQVEVATAEQNYQRYSDLLAAQDQLRRDAESQQQQAAQAKQLVNLWQPAADQARRYEQAVVDVTAWLEQYDSLAALRQDQQRHQHLRHEHELLQRLADHLQAHGHAADFPLSGWAGAASSAAEADLENLRLEVAASRQQHVFTNLTSPGSLAGWAFRRGQPLSLAEESILTHFGRQADQRHEETEPNHYLHDPDELFASPLETVQGEHNSGFWLHLRGVRMWVPLLAEADRAFMDADETRLTELFASRQQDSQRNLHQLTIRLAHEEAVQAVLHQLPDWQAALAAYQRREAIEQALQASLLPETSIFDETLAHYQADTATQARHRASIQQANEAADQLADAQVGTKLLATQQAANNKALAQFSESPAKLLVAVDKARLAAAQAAATLSDWLRETEFLTANLPYQEAELANLSLNQLKLGGTAATQQATMIAQQLAEQQATQYLATCRTRAQEAVAAYVKLTGQPAPVLPLTVPSLAEEPLPTAWDEARTIYEREFDSIKDGLAPIHQERVQYDDGPALLMRELLPDVVHEVVESAEALALVSERLQSINETNRQIARLKVQLLRGVFDRVRTQYYIYVEETKKIRSYFLSKKVQITGGFKPELSYTPSTDFPIDWIALFGQVLSEQAGGELGKFAQLSSAETLEELMCQAYKSNGGPLENPKAVDLLNPRSYLNLTFNMTSSRVKVNKGSTGQTFMAAALLNIARLSVIGDSEQQPGVRFIPVDEAHGLGSNYGVLLELARDKGYQVLSLSVEPMIDEASERHRTYFLAFDPDAEALLNLHPTMLSAEQKLVQVPDIPVFPTSLFDDDTRQ